MSLLDPLLQRAGITIGELAGASVAGEIPLSNAVVNRFIGTQLARRQLPVSSVQLDAQEGDIFSAYVVPRTKFVPPLRIHFRIERQPDFPGDPVLWLRWSMPGIGRLALLATPALSFFKALPPGIRVDGDRIAVDPRALLAAQGLGEVVGYVRDMRVHTRAGAFVVRVELRA